MTADSPANQRKPVFYGWYIVATCIFVAFVTNGARNSFGIFVLPMERRIRLGAGATISFGSGLGLLGQRFYPALYGQTARPFWRA